MGDIETTDWGIGKGDFSTVTYKGLGVELGDGERASHNVQYLVLWKERLSAFFD